jgi:hypothetical protein
MTAMIIPKTADTENVSSGWTVASGDIEGIRVDVMGDQEFCGLYRQRDWIYVPQFFLVSIQIYEVKPIKMRWPVDVDCTICQFPHSMSWLGITQSLKQTAPKIWYLYFMASGGFRASFRGKWASVSQFAFLVFPDRSSTSMDFIYIDVSRVLSCNPDRLICRDLCCSIHYYSLACRSRLICRDYSTAPELVKPGVLGSPHMEVVLWNSTFEISGTYD